MLGWGCFLPEPGPKARSERAVVWCCELGRFGLSPAHEQAQPAWRLVESTATWTELPASLGLRVWETCLVIILADLSTLETIPTPPSLLTME